MVFHKERQLVPSSRIVATGVKSIVTDEVAEVGRGYVPMHIRRKIKLHLKLNIMRNVKKQDHAIPRNLGVN